MNKEFIEAIEGLLSGIQLRFSKRKFCELVPFVTPEKTVLRIPAYYEGQEFRMVHEYDVASGLVYFVAKDSRFSGDEQTSTGIGRFSTSFRAVGIMHRSDFDCPHLAQFEMADNIIAQLGGWVTIGTKGKAWVGVDAVNTDQIQILNTEFYNRLTWSESLALCSIDFSANANVMNKCLTNRIDCQ